MSDVPCSISHVSINPRLYLINHHLLTCMRATETLLPNFPAMGLIRLITENLNSIKDSRGAELPEISFSDLLSMVGCSATNGQFWPFLDTIHNLTKEEDGVPFEY
jgi:hypothetical protein